MNTERRIADGTHPAIHPSRQRRPPALCRAGRPGRHAGRDAARHHRLVALLRIGDGTPAGIAPRLRTEPARTRRVGPSRQLPHARLRRRRGRLHRGARPRPGACRRTFDGQRERDAPRHRPARPASRPDDWRVPLPAFATRPSSSNSITAPSSRCATPSTRASPPSGSKARWRNRCRRHSSTGSCASAFRLRRSVWRDAFAALFDDDFAAEIDRIAVPTLVVWGDRDAMARPATRSGSSARSRARVCSPTRARGMRCIGKSPHALPTTLRASRTR